MKLTWVPLEGHGIRLEPLSMAHAKGLFAASSLETFRYFAGLQPKGPDEEAFKDYIQVSLKAPNTFAYAVIQDGRPVGMSSFMDIRHEHSGLEIGMTWISAECRGTRVNPAMKLLMLGHAFACGAIRVQLKMDARNERSRRAVAKLGAVYEGTLRKHMRVGDGFLRDTVMFSILPEEWPEVRSRLENRLAG